MLYSAIMIILDRSKIKTFTEPGCFGDISHDYDCITVEYAQELVRQANLEIQELYNQIAEMSKDNTIGKIPLTLEHVCSAVSSFTKLPYSNVQEYAKTVFKPENYSVHFVNLDGVWTIESAVKIKDCDLVTFIRNFKSMVDCSQETRLPANKFNEYTQHLFDEFKKQNNLP